MKRITWAFWAFLLGLTALWLMADTLWPAQPGYFALRTVWVQYSGVLVMGAMSLAMLLAVRPVWLERHLDGLDKMYRLHKWLGIAALAIGTVHWLWAKGTKWAVGWGWLTRPPRGPRSPAENLGLAEATLRDWRGLAEGVGEWAFYAAVLLIVTAMPVVAIVCVSLVAEPVTVVESPVSAPSASMSEPATSKAMVPDALLTKVSLSMAVTVSFELTMVSMSSKSIVLVAMSPS